jgi:hypothetical protein
MPAMPYDASRTALFTPQNRPTLFVPGQAYDVRALCVEAARLAYVHAENGGAELQTLTDALAIVGFDAPTCFSDSTTGTQGFGAIRQADGLALLAFRGTEPTEFSDIATDLKASLVTWPESAGRVHDGFATATRSILPAVTQWLAQSHGQLIITGHSLGAAIACLMASVCKPQTLVTIGCPRVGDAAFKATLDGIDHTRLVDCSDIVTELPPAIDGYVHVAPMTYITSEGLIDANADEASIAADRAAARAAYLCDYAWRTGTVVVRDLADHAPVNYARAVFP